MGKCETCKFFHPIWSAQDVERPTGVDPACLVLSDGFCRHGPPTPQLRATLDVIAPAFWPTVTKNDWCGQYWPEQGAGGTDDE